jgi:carboxypeptidase Q
VVYNYLFDMSGDPLPTYREGTQYRGSGASRAAKYGAVAVLIRSVGPIAHRTPHTGAMRYSPDAPQIPAVSLSGEDADKLQRMQDRGQKLEINIKLQAKTLPDAESANVVAEIKGREKPEEVVVIGGHIDSWDITPGALDDGGGDISTWEALRILKKLNLVPRRTIRLVLFTNEENGGRGGRAYVEQHASELGNHVFALESDNGVLPLKGFNFRGTPEAKSQFAPIIALLAPMGADHIGDKFEEADITPMQRLGIPAVGPEVDMHKYFYVHHTPADTVDKVDRSELNRVIAGIAVMSYVIADMPGKLERGAPITTPTPGRGQ